MYLALKEYKGHFKKGDIVGMSDKYAKSLLKEGYLEKLTEKQAEQEVTKLRKENK